MTLNAFKSIPGAAMASQAVCAVLFIEAISHFVGLERVYWAEIGATMVICQSFGESLRKSLRRALATLLGAVAGALACHLLDAGNLPVWLHYAFALCGAMVALRCYPERYQAYVFWLCFGLVFLLDAAGRRGEELAFVRIYEAALGSVCGSIAAFLILPLRSRERAERQLEALALEAKDLLKAALPAFQGQAAPEGFEKNVKAFDAETCSLDALLSSLEMEEAIALPEEGPLAGRLVALRAFREQLSSLLQRIPCAKPPEGLAEPLAKWQSLIAADIERTLEAKSPAKAAEPQGRDELREGFREEMLALFEARPELKRGSAQALSTMHWLLALRDSAAALQGPARI